MTDTDLYAGDTPPDDTPAGGPDRGPTASSSAPETMRAAVYERYGRPEEVVQVRAVPVPEPGPGEVRVRVAAASVNALDWHFVTGLPMFARPTLGLRRPKRHVPGADVSGVVVALGAGVAGLATGDEVFGEVDGGAFAELVVAPAERLVRVPEGVGLERAATIGVAATTALQALRDWGGLRPGQRVLVIGASGGVGSFAVQVAKALGAAHVTAVCSTRNVGTARRIGADRVLDYTRGDVRELGERFDLVLDNAGTLSLRDCRRLLGEQGAYVMVTSPKSRWVHPLPRMLRLPLYFALVSQRAPAFKVAQRSRSDLELLAGWVSAGVVDPVLDRRYPLADAAEALRVQGEFHARGKSLVIP